MHTGTKEEYIIHLVDCKPLELNDYRRSEKEKLESAFVIVVCLQMEAVMFKFLGVKVKVYIKYIHTRM